MPQSAAEATRFTSTTPHISSSPGKDNVVKLHPRRPGPPGETPLEKVRRLRAAAEKARQSQISTVDRWILRGRLWADAAHTITTTFLIAASFVAGGVTIYALTDMILYNRRKRAEYFEEQKAKLQLAIDTARIAIQDGTATEAQINFIKLEEENRASEKEKQQKQNLFSQSKKWLFAGLKETGEEDEESSAQIFSIKNTETETKTSPIMAAAVHDKASVITSSAKEAFAKERKSLDQTDVQVKNEDQSSSGGWTSWIFGR